jgi:DNA-binding Lrp family transcriptional regulator
MDVRFCALPLSSPSPSPSPVASCHLPVANIEELNMYDDLLVKLIAESRLSHGRIAERVGVSRRTVWRIANGLARPDLQKKIAAVVEGYRQAAIRTAATHMKSLLEKQIEVALEGDGETSRKCREFLLKTFMLAIPDQTAKTEEKAEQAAERDAEKQAANADDETPLNPQILTRALHDLSPGLMEEICKELFGADYKDHGVHQAQAQAPTAADTSDRNRSP